MSKKMTLSIVLILAALLVLASVAYSQGIFPFTSLAKKGPPWEEMQASIVTLRADMKIVLGNHLQKLQLVSTRLAEIQAEKGTIVGHVMCQLPTTKVVGFLPRRIMIQAFPDGTLSGTTATPTLIT